METRLKGQEDRSEKKPLSAKAVAKGAVEVIAYLAVFSGITFGCAGRLDWAAAWIYLAVMVAGSSINSAVMIASATTTSSKRAARNSLW